MNQFDIKEIFLNNIKDNTTLNIALALVEEWDDYKKVLDKIKEILKKHIRKDGFLELNEWQTRELNELLEEIE